MRIHIIISKLDHISELEAVLKWCHDLPVKKPCFIEVDVGDTNIWVQPPPEEKNE